MRGTLCRTSPKRPIDAICVPIEVILTSVFSELAIEIRDDTRSKETTMPLWKVYHPVGAYTREDKHALSKRITDVYAEVPLPKFYVSGGINDTCEIHGCNRLSGQGPPSRDRRFESHFPAKSRANDGHRCDLVANSNRSCEPGRNLREARSVAPLPGRALRPELGYISRALSSAPPEIRPITKSGAQKERARDRGYRKALSVRACRSPPSR